MSELGEQLREFIEAHRWNALVHHGIEGYEYQGPADFVLREGQPWPFRTTRRRWARYSRWGAPKCCYANSILAAITHDDLSYCEGWAYCEGLIPVQHAWNIDGEGFVVDFTWRLPESKPRDRAYFGAVIDTETANEAIDAGGTPLDDWQRDWPLLREPYEPRRAA
jgi:hypothetical protein